MTDYESLIAEVQQEHREQMTEIGRARSVRRGTRSVRGIICKPFMHFGQPITMRQLAKRSGIPYMTLFRRKRYQGLSDADLVRPPVPSQHIDLVKLRELASTGIKATEYGKGCRRHHGKLTQSTQALRPVSHVADG